MDNLFQILTDIRNFIAKNELDEAISLLSTLLQKEKKLDEVILQSARNHHLETEVSRGTISWADASIKKAQITFSLLQICRDIDENILGNVNNALDVDAVESGNRTHILHEYPKGPSVDLIDESIVKAYARLISPEHALMYIGKANSLRKEADINNNKVTILQPYTLLTPSHAKPFDFWLDAFREAGLHGPRMLAALLYVLPDDQFTQEARTARKNLLNLLKNHN